MLRYAGNSGKVIEKSQMLQAKDRTLFEKIRDYLTDLVNRIKKAYKDVRPETPEGEIISGMLDKAEEIQQLFTDAIADASENFKGAEVIENKSDTKNDVKYSFAGRKANTSDIQTLETAIRLEDRDFATRSWRTDEARKEKRPDTDRTDVVFADSVKYSDRNYLEAVESGDMTTAQRMVDETAEKSNA